MLRDYGRSKNKHNIVLCKYNIRDISNRRIKYSVLALHGEKYCGICHLLKILITAEFPI